MSSLQQSVLGKKSQYQLQYDPEQLFSIARQTKRDEIQVFQPLPFYGVDIWNHYEVSWLDANGKPIVAIAQIHIDCHSPNIIESKSMKLYFNSFNQMQYADQQSIQAVIEQDLTQRIGSSVQVTIWRLTDNAAPAAVSVNQLTGSCLDELTVTCSEYTVNPGFLTSHKEKVAVTETVYSHLLKSNCLVTNQPDWGSVQISYQGPQINHAGLLQYIVSFRNHNEFGEHCIERMYMDIMRQCQPQVLMIAGYYTRRGGIDINVYRSNQPLQQLIQHQRLYRQ
ncbi:MAG TPA: NADPH-dependent 7-cyano-7-deazaguanine reductase QueF [Gammaproteobacteria bacterium]|jgi:7-cyano-7-deazaguanine reductase|nr:NADPH-dependent 7-cyano-7-deazaguanine reductase QueF [Gammaproteobacteria bacterium]